jgi:hypothetical protein
VGQREPAPRARDAYVEQAAFLREREVGARAAFRLVQRTGVREDAFFQSDQEDVIELQPLRRVERHERDRAAVRPAVVPVIIGG